MNRIQRLVDSVLASVIPVSKAEYKKPKDLWWDNLTQKQQHLYIKAHPNTTKKLTLHTHKLIEHEEAAKLHDRNIDFLGDKLGKIKDPMRLQKEEDKLDNSVNMKSYHNHQAAFHRHKIAETADDNVPEFGDEKPETAQEAIETPAKHTIKYDPHEPEEFDEPEVDETPESPDAEEDKPASTIMHDDNPQSEEVVKSRATRVIGRFLHHFKKSETNPIVKAAMNNFRYDKDSMATLDSAFNHAKTSHTPPPRLIKKLGLIAAIILATAMGGVLVGAVGAVFIAHHMNEHYNHGRGLGHWAWDAIKRKDHHSWDDRSDKHEQVVEAMIDHLREELAKADTDESTSRIELLIETLEDSARKYSLNERETKKRVVKKRHVEAYKKHSKSNKTRSMHGAKSH